MLKKPPRCWTPTNEHVALVTSKPLVDRDVDRAITRGLREVL
jgi:hypothetical protein